MIADGGNAAGKRLVQGGAIDELFRLALEAAPTGMIMVDRSGTIVLVNAHIEKLFGYAREELIGQPIEVLVPQRYQSNHPGYRNGFYGTSKARPMGAGRDLFGRRKDGNEVPVEIGLNPLVTSDGEFVLSSVVDITERKRMDQELRAQVRERDVLLQEVHHRVKNNLQVISSLINLQLAGMPDAPSRNALEECSTRVQAIALIHEQLYQARNFAHVPFSDYAQNLAAAVFRTTRVVAESLDFTVDIEPVMMPVDTAIPCGLILSELITNAVKHAFPSGRGGSVSVTLRKIESGTLLLSVSDDGVGLPQNFDPRECDSLGMRLILTLAHQIDAQFGFSSDAGAQFTLRMKDTADQKS